jgi:hypothetical protein
LIADHDWIEDSKNSDRVHCGQRTSAQPEGASFPSPRTKGHTKSILQVIAGFGSGQSLLNGMKTKALGVASGKSTLGDRDGDNVLERERRNSFGVRRRSRNAPALHSER